MRCPHCAGEVLDGSRFCGICGREIGAASPRGAAVAGAPVAPAPPAARHDPGPRAESPAAIELPISPGARWARTLVVLALDVVLAGAGLFMILSYAQGCDHSGRAPAAPADLHEPGSAPEARK